MTTPLQVYLDDDDAEALDAFATARGWTKSQVVRAALRALTRQAVDDPLLELSGDIDGLPADFSANFDSYLEESFVAEPRPSYRSRSRR